MNLDLKIGGIDYNVNVDIEDDYVSAVLGVSVFDGEMFVELDLKNADLEEFYSTYVDQLNERYIEYREDLAISAAEAKWELANDR